MANPLLRDLEKSSIFTAALHGARTLVEHNLGISDVLFATNDTVKAELVRKGGAVFPYAYITLNELRGVRDKLNTKLMRREGVRIGLAGASKATTAKAFIFPVDASFELVYVDSDPMRAIQMAEALTLLSQIGVLTYELVIGEDFRLNCSIEIPDSVSIPLADSGNLSAPDAIEMRLTFVMHAYVGFLKDLPAVSSSSPLIHSSFL